MVYTLSFAYILEEIIDMLLYSQNTKFEYQQATHLIAKIVQDDMVRP